MYYIILNPTSKSGQGIHIWKKIEPILADRQIPYRLVFSRYQGHVAKLVEDIMEHHRGSEKPVKVILLGGDGTLNEALQGISDFSKIHIGYIPTGSSNDFARDMEFLRDPAAILLQILDNDLQRQVRLLDLGVLRYHTASEDSEDSENAVQTRYFAVSTGIGYDAAVCQEALASRFKKILNRLHLGKLTYLTIALRQLMGTKPVICDFTIHGKDGDETIHLDRFYFIASMIHQYQGGGFKFCPGADATDGILDLCVAGALSKPKILMALPTAYKGLHFRFKNIDRYAAERLEIRTSMPLWVHTDGEVPCQSSHLEISSLPRTLRLMN